MVSQTIAATPPLLSVKMAYCSPKKGVLQKRLASQAYRATRGVARNSIANRAIVGHKGKNPCPSFRWCFCFLGASLAGNFLGLLSVFCIFSRVLRVRRVRRILGVFEVFLALSGANRFARTRFARIDSRESFAIETPIL